MRFQNRIVMIGFGVVARALLPLLIKHLRVKPEQFVVIDFADRQDALAPWTERGLRFVRERVTPFSLARLLSAHARHGDLIVDLAWSVDFFDIVTWAQENGVLYVNASIESWDIAEEMQKKPLIEKSLYSRYAQLLKLRELRRHCTTALVDQGANPGLISSFVKTGLLDLGEAVLEKCKLRAPVARQLERLIARDEFAQLARLLDVKTIHCSERDTQRANRAKNPDEFVSTWSVDAMWEEAISPCELGWGTHEKWMPPTATVPDQGPCNQIILPQMGMNAWARSWVPDHEVVGMVVTHGESFTLSHLLTVKQGSRDIYRPTVHFVYMPCGDSLVSLHELRARNYELHPSGRILADEIVTGSDSMGALIMGHKFNAWWTGSVLSIEEARTHVPGVNATAVQVASGVLAGVLWALRNPKRGICLPEDIPHRETLDVARAYLGRFVSQPVDWTPLSQHRDYFEPAAEPQLDRADPWQFSNFVFRP